MKVSISEARKRLPQLVRQIRTAADTTVRITVHNQVVAELRAAQPQPEPGAAARALMQLMSQLPKHRGKKTRVSSRAKDYLYRRGGARR